MQPASGGTLGEVEHHCHLGRGELLPDHEKKNLALILGKHRQDPPNRLSLRYRIQSGVGVWPRVQRIWYSNWNRWPHGLTPVGIQDVSSDPIQPWERIGASPAHANLERSQPDLAEEIVCVLTACATGQERVDRRAVTPKEVNKGRWVACY